MIGTWLVPYIPNHPSGWLGAGALQAQSPITVPTGGLAFPHLGPSLDSVTELLGSSLFHPGGADLYKSKLQDQS